MDTLIRIFDKKFYETKEIYLRTLEDFNTSNARFLVFGRQIDDTYKTLNELSVPSQLRDRFLGISESEFRLDISSREIKKHQEETKIPA